MVVEGKSRDEVLEQGRHAFAREAWSQAYERLSAADRESPLELDDLERLGMAAYLLDRNEEGGEALARAYRLALRAGERARAARSAFWIGFELALGRGEEARGGGWLARAKRLMEEAQEECVEHGYVLVPQALQRLEAGDPAGALEAFGATEAIAERFGDADLMTLSRMGRGRAAILLGETAMGIALLDDVMVGVTAGEASPLVAGIAYCFVVDTCVEIFDIRRAQQWTEAMTRWLQSQPEMGSFHGECLIHRAEIMQLHGAWHDALVEAQRACERLARSSTEPHVGAGLYLQAELHRLRGQFAKAEETYREASRLGRPPQPGLALLRLAQGQPAAAVAAIRRAAAEAGDLPRRCSTLAACVEIMLEVGDRAAARAAADALAAIARDLDAPMLRAMSAQAEGAVRLAEGDAGAAIEALREAWDGWQALDAPYEAARVRVLTARAYQLLGDADTAELELDAARRVFRRLGATPDLQHAESPAGRAAGRTVEGLTVREVEVLRLVAAGKTNRAIADELVISEKTVARHLSNIFTKLGLSSRAAATAYAYEHGLV